VKPDGFRIPPDAARIHGITQEHATKEGFPVRDILYELGQAAATAGFVIAHNADFDGSVLAAEYLRQGWSPPFAPDSMVCTMKAGIDCCRLPGPRGYKWPKLEELHQHLFGTSFEGAHDASADVAACACCFFEMKNRGLITVL
jgi:DNA polymerase III epsilon subunit-like protein